MPPRGGDRPLARVQSDGRSSPSAAFRLATSPRALLPFRRRLLGRDDLEGDRPQDFRPLGQSVVEGEVQLVVAGREALEGEVGPHVDLVGRGGILRLVLEHRRLLPEDVLAPLLAKPAVLGEQGAEAVLGPLDRVADGLVIDRQLVVGRQRRVGQRLEAGEAVDLRDDDRLRHLQGRRVVGPGRHGDQGDETGDRRRAQHRSSPSRAGRGAASLPRTIAGPPTPTSMGSSEQSSPADRVRALMRWDGVVKVGPCARVSAVAKLPATGPGDLSQGGFWRVRPQSRGREGGGFSQSSKGRDARSRPVDKQRWRPDCPIAALREAAFDGSDVGLLRPDSSHAAIGGAPRPRRGSSRPSPRQSSARGRPPAGPASGCGPRGSCLHPPPRRRASRRRR